MATKQSSYQRQSLTDAFSLLKPGLGNQSSPGSNSTERPPQTSTSTTNGLGPDFSLGFPPGNPSSLQPLSSDFAGPNHAKPVMAPSSCMNQPPQRHARPVSEILKPDSLISPEAQELDKWFEDLQQYERNLEAMASASLDPKYKEEVQHVDQWFRYLNEAERTATIYTLLQHSSQVQVRFFITVLQQMGKKDPVAALLSPAHPEKAGAMAKAELEASQKLLSALPYQTGQVRSRPNATNQRRNIDRHSFALGDTEEYDRMFGTSRMGASGDFLTPRSAVFGPSLMDEPMMARPRLQSTRGVFNARPRSVIEGDLSSIFNGDWPYGGGANGAGLVGGVNERTSSGRPKSADISNWSLGGRDDVQPWGLSPTMSTFGEHGQTIERPNSASDIDPRSMLPNNWHGSSNRSVMLSDDTDTFRRRGINRTGIPAVPETDERQGQANIVLSMYEDAHCNKPPTTPTRPRYPPYHVQSPTPTHKHPSQSTTSPAPSASSSSNLPSARNTCTPKKHGALPHPAGPASHFGQFLNPNDRVEGETDYLSDHSDASNVSGSNRHKKKTGFGQQRKDKKNADVVDMKLLEDVPAWLRSLRLHKYNPIFESMKWKDMLRLNDEELREKGVSALGARRKLLKVFDQIKQHCEINVGLEE
ncbi:Flap-structured DNA-binding and RNA-binding protein [Apophysomyces sp. BC1021]|nr:Flap-structured DNA-binding and RNA-binding protein [Apophysomyces sp. BC1021]